MDLSKRLQIIRIEAGAVKPIEDQVVVEYSLTLSVNGKHVADFVCLPGDLEDLICGHLYSQGIISQRQQILRLSFAADEVTVQVDAGRRQSPPVYKGDFSLGREDIYKAVAAFSCQSPLFVATGGVHSCSLYHRDGRQIYREDIGRHNAADKAFGRALHEGWDMSKAFLLTSGRVASALVTKAENVGLYLLISVGAPTAEAVNRAVAADITLCGFARGPRFNVYSARRRILTQ